MVAHSPLGVRRSTQRFRLHGLPRLTLPRRRNHSRLSAITTTRPSSSSSTFASRLPALRISCLFPHFPTPTRGRRDAVRVFLRKDLPSKLTEDHSLRRGLGWNGRAARAFAGCRHSHLGIKPSRREGQRSLGYSCWSFGWAGVHLRFQRDEHGHHQMGPDGRSCVLLQETVGDANAQIYQWLTYLAFCRLS